METGPHALLQSCYAGNSLPTFLICPEATVSVAGGEKGTASRRLSPTIVY